MTIGCWPPFYDFFIQDSSFICYVYIHINKGSKDMNDVWHVTKVTDHDIRSESGCNKSYTQLIIIIVETYHLYIKHVFTKHLQVKQIQTWT
jgi:hypothetical protein